MELKKRKEDFSPLIASTAGMSPRTLAAHNFYKGRILSDIEAEMFTILLLFIVVY
jgi:hypothetical protein